MLDVGIDGSRNSRVLGELSKVIDNQGAYLVSL